MSRITSASARLYAYVASEHPKGIRTQLNRLPSLSVNASWWLDGMTPSASCSSSAWNACCASSAVNSVDWLISATMSRICAIGYHSPTYFLLNFRRSSAALGGWPGPLEMSTIGKLLREVVGCISPSSSHSSACRVISAFAAGALGRSGVKLGVRSVMLNDILMSLINPTLRFSELKHSMFFMITRCSLVR